MGMSFALLFPGVVGATILAASTLSVVVGELIGPTSLRRMLEKVGEAQDVLVGPEPSPAVEAAS